MFYLTSSSQFLQQLTHVVYDHAPDSPLKVLFDHRHHRVNYCYVTVIIIITITIIWLWLLLILNDIML
jgi:hypothetical protein